MFPTWDGVKQTLLKSRVCSLTLVRAVSVKSRLTGEAGKRRGGAEVEAGQTQLTLPSTEEGAKRPEPGALT